LKICLAIGGSDSCGGAGIQADLATFAAFGMKGCSAITALTAQNPDEIKRMEISPVSQLEFEIDAIFEYYEVAAVKTGMLVDAERIALIATLLRKHHDGKPLVVDPVLTATSGKRLLDKHALHILGAELLPQATLITPNLPEASVLLAGEETGDPAEDADRLVMRFNSPVLVKGGHANTDSLVDILCDSDGIISALPHARQSWDREYAHGSGGRLEAAIAAGWASGAELYEAVKGAVDWQQEASKMSGNRAMSNPLYE